MITLEAGVDGWRYSDGGLDRDGQHRIRREAQRSPGLGDSSPYCDSLRMSREEGGQSYFVSQVHGRGNPASMDTAQRPATLLLLEDALRVN